MSLTSHIIVSYNSELLIIIFFNKTSYLISIENSNGDSDQKYHRKGNVSVCNSAIKQEEDHELSSEFNFIENLNVVLITF